MSSTELTTQEENFIDLLLDGNSVSKAASTAGYSAVYGYTLKKKLSKFIVEAAQDYLALHAIKAAKHAVDVLEDDMPNPIKLQAAWGILDRVGVIKKDNTPITTIKANIFILPEKRSIDYIDHE